MAATPIFDSADHASLQAMVNAIVSAGGGSGMVRKGTHTGDIVLPAVDPFTDAAMPIRLFGEMPQSQMPAVIGDTLPLPAKGAIIVGRIYVPAEVDGWSYPFSMLQLELRDLLFRRSADPATATVDLHAVTAVAVDRLTVDAGQWRIASIAEPANTGGIGIRFPANNNGACTRVGTTLVVGHYCGYEIAEHTNGSQMSAWGCKRAAQVPGAYHASYIQRFMSVHCHDGLVATGGSPQAGHRLDIGQYDVELAATGWFSGGKQVVDSSNYLHGQCRYASVRAVVGAVTTFSKTGGENFACTDMGGGVTE